MNATHIYLAIIGFFGWGFVQLLLAVRDMMPGFAG